MTKNEIKKLDALWREKVRNKAQNKCEISKEKNTKLDCHHYIGRRNRSTRWYIPNGILLTSGNHTFKTQSAHQDVEWFRKEMIEIRGEEWLKDLWQQSNKIFKGTYQQVEDYLNGKTENYV